MRKRSERMQQTERPPTDEAVALRKNHVMHRFGGARAAYQAE